MFSLFFNLITHWLQFMLSIYFCIWGHPVKQHGRSIRNYIYIYIFKENQHALPPPRKPSIFHSSSVRGGAKEPLSTLCRSVAFVWSSAGSCSCCELTRSLVLMARRCCVVPVLPTSGSYKLSPHFTVVPELWRGRGTEKSCLWLRTLQSLTLCMWVSWRFLS